jgi:putative FmdB family regulatory protein
MPTYEYKCPAGHVFEKFFPTMHSRRREKCPVCGKQAERQISAGTGLVFKGSGFYTTDYKRAGEKRESQDEPKPVTESKPAESKPAESKPAESKPSESPRKKKDSGDK